MFWVSGAAAVVLVSFSAKARDGIIHNVTSNISGIIIRMFLGEIVTLQVANLFTRMFLYFRSISIKRLVNMIYRVFLHKYVDYANIIYRYWKENSIVMGIGVNFLNLLLIYHEKMSYNIVICAGLGGYFL